MVAKMDMYLQVKKVIQKHSSSWTEITAFGTAYSNFNEKLADLQGLSNGQVNAMLGVRALKEEKRNKAISSAMEVLGAIKAYASANSLPDLKVQMAISASKMRYASKKNLLHFLNRILEKANEYSTALEGYGIDQAKIETFTALRNELEIAIDTPRSAVIERKTFTLKIRESFAELDEILKGQLDTLMLVLKNEHQDFYKDYIGARVVIEPKSPPKGKSTETNTETYD